MPKTFQIGDLVECRHDVEWQTRHQEADRGKARKLNKKTATFTGNAAAYMHLDEAYVVDDITKTGGLKLRGFAPPVSPDDVRISYQKVFR